MRLTFPLLSTLAPSRRRACVVLCGAFCIAPLFAADAIPDWVRQAAETPAPPYSAKVTSAVLLHEEAVTVDAEGKRVMRERGAIKVLQPGGEPVSASRLYNAKSGRIRDFQGWLTLPGGKPTAFAKNRIIDFSPINGEVYDEYKGKALECGCPTPGAVFAWEVTEEEKSIFTQDSFGFQRRDPVLLSRYSVTLPAAWEAKGVIFNHASFDPQVGSSTYTWELKNLPWIEKEDYSASLSALAPRLAVSFFPPSDNRTGLQGLKDWSSVSGWLAPIVDPPAAVTDAVALKAGQLIANAPGELDRIRALAAYVQQTNYVEVDLNLTRAGGYTPRRAEDTLNRNYGDCKDKATLLRSLLKAVGIDSYLVTITSGDRSFVRPEWASPRQFNHAIVAIGVSSAVQMPTVVPETSVGRLLIFDPTDSITPVGDLPSSEQGSYALVIAGAKGQLVQMPVLPSESARVESVVEGNVDPDGKLTAKIERQYFGQSSVPIRATQKLRGSDELKKRIEEGYARSLGATTVSGITTTASAAENRVSVHLDLAAERFAQSMQGRLFIVRPGMLTGGGEYLFRSKQRTTPVRLESGLHHDVVRLKLPQGYKLDEIPSPAMIEGPYGSLTVAWSVKDGEAVMDQTFQVRQITVQPSEYAGVRDFFDRVAGAQGAPVVLVKQ